MAIRLGGKRIREDAGANKYSKVDFEKRFGIKLGSNIGVTGTGRQVGASLFAVMLTGFLGSFGLDICYTEIGVPREKRLFCMTALQWTRDFLQRDLSIFMN